MQKLIDSFIEYCRVEKDFVKSTIACYKSQLRQFFSKVNTPLEEITPQVIREYLKGFDTIHKRIAVVSALKCFGKFLRAEGKEDPFDHLGFMKAPRKLPVVLSEAEMTQLISKLETIKEKIVFETLYSTGLRINEFIHLELEDIDFKKGTIKVRHGKGSRWGGAPERIIPIGRPPLKLIKKYGLPKFTKYEIYQIFEKYSKVLGKYIHPHMMRKTCATHMLNRGADIRYVQEQLRHASINSTVIYTKVYPETLKKTQELLEKKGSMEGRLPYVEPFEPRKWTPEEIAERKELIESTKAILKRDSVNPFLNDRAVADILGICEQTVNKYAETGDLKGEYSKGLGWFFRSSYIKLVKQVDPEWLKRARRPNLREMVIKTLRILMEEGKMLYPDVSRVPKAERHKYITNSELAKKLGVSYNTVSLRYLPALKRYLFAKKWAEEKLKKAYEEELKEFELGRDKLLTSDIVDALV